MNPETLVILVGFLWGGLVLLRIHKRRRANRGKPPTAPAVRPETGRREMPRVGEPGTITFNQIQALRRNNFTPDRSWSREEAALILDAVKYLRAVCRDVSDADDGPPPLDIQNAVLRFILTEQDIRDYVRKWGEGRRHAGLGDYGEDEPILSRNNQYGRVEAEARKFLMPEEVAGTTL
jgi:hypothetical protein